MSFGQQRTIFVQMAKVSMSRVYLRILILLRIALRNPLGKRPRDSRTRSYTYSYSAHIWNTFVCLDY